MDVFRGYWLYFWILVTSTVGESLLKKRHIACMIVALEATRLQMYKHYGKTLSMRVIKNEQRLMKRGRVNSSFVSAHAP